MDAMECNTKRNRSIRIEDELWYWLVREAANDKKDVSVLIREILRKYKSKMYTKCTQNRYKGEV